MLVLLDQGGVGDRETILASFNPNFRFLRVEIGVDTPLEYKNHFSRTILKTVNLFSSFNQILGVTDLRLWRWNPHSGTDRPKIP